jgi:hypothetical protein
MFLREIGTAGNGALRRLERHDKARGRRSIGALAVSTADQPEERRARADLDDAEAEAAYQHHRTTSQDLGISRQVAAGAAMMERCWSRALAQELLLALRGRPSRGALIQALGSTRGKR